jgi:hypothetical protein
MQGGVYVLEKLSKLATMRLQEPLLSVLYKPGWLTSLTRHAHCTPASIFTLRLTTVRLM